MRILFISIAWPVEGRKNLYTDLVQSLKKKGHEVTVVTISEKRRKEGTTFVKENGIDVLRIRHGNITKTNSLTKGINLMTLNYKFESGIKRILNDTYFELIIATTPPITLSKLLKKLKQKYSAKVYLLLKDIWPQGSVDLGVIKKNGWIWNYFRSHEKRIYKTADYIGCMSPRNVEYLLKENPFLDKEKVEVCPNTIASSKNGLLKEGIREKYDIPMDAVVFLFSGNLGLGHGLEFYYNVIKKLEGYKKAFFVIGGSGTHYAMLEKKIQSDKPDNLLLYSWLPDEDFKQMLLLSDVGVILLKGSYTTPQFPSRLLAYLNASIPVFCVVNKSTDIGEIVESHEAGISILHGDENEFISAVKKFCMMTRETRRRMGKNANNLLLSEYTADIGADIILNHFVETESVIS